MRRLNQALIVGLFLLMQGILPAFSHTNNYKVLIFSKTAGYRHSSISNGIAMIQTLGTNNHFQVDATEDSTAFTDTNLTQYKAVVFLSTTGDVLNTNQQAAFERFIRAGKGYVGIHAASDTEYGWPWYGQLVGAYFQGHPSEQNATIIVADRVHPSTAPLPQKWVRYDEWYNFQSNPRTNVHVLATLDEKTYSGGSMGFDHPTAWCHDFDGGRAWYTGGGHTEASYAEPLFQAHVLGGIEYAAGVKKGDSASVETNFQLRTLDSAAGDQPMSLAVAPDGRVFYVERSGLVKVYDPITSTPSVAGQLNVFHELEDGLLGIALDPGFGTNHWLYLIYSPIGDTPKQHVSRFTVAGNVLDFASEKILLEIPTQRDQCCHSAGSLAFGPDGTLYISTGDNTNPFESDSFTPIDERAGRSAWDAQKSASNINDLRGKILRIRPEADGTYSIPNGNLFPSDGSAGKPEIFVMGCRNPYRISVDEETGWLYWGEVGPDAYSDSANRGPKGYDEINQARSAGNYGWPYFVADNKPYRKYNFATGASGAFFDAAMPTNNSPNNTGAQLLPPARNAWIWYPYGLSTEFPEMNGQPLGNRTAMVGPVYHFNTNLVSARKFPAYYDKTLFIYELSRVYIKEVKLDDNGNVLKISPFMPSLSRTIMDMEMGPDGALYILTWFPSSLIRIEYVAGDYAPVAVANATPSSGSVPLTVQFSSAGSLAVSTNPALSFAWSFFGNGVTNSTNANPQFTYTQAGNYNAQLTVTDSKGNQAIANVQIIVGNNRPIVTIDDPPNGAVFDWGHLIHYRARVTDIEDGSTANGTIPCANLMVESSLGHNEHAHSDSAVNGCDGVFQAPVYDADEIGNVYLKLDASYTDNGAPNTISLRGTTTHILQPRRKEAEYFTSRSAVTTQLTSDLGGEGSDVGSIDHGDWISLAPVNLTNISSLTCRVASTLGGRIEIRSDSINGALLGTLTIPDTSAVYTSLTIPIINPGGTHELFFVFLRNPGDADLFVLNWIQFQGSGVTLPVILQSSGTINGVYLDDAAALFDHDLQTISLPVTNASRFYRLRSGASLKIENIQIIGTNAVMTYK